MALTLPASPPPPSLRARAIPFLLSRLSSTPPSDPSAVLSVLVPLLRALSTSLSSSAESTPPPLLPLHALLHLGSAPFSPSSTTPRLPLQALLDALVLYPLHGRALSLVADRLLASDPTALETIRTDLLPALVSRLYLTPAPAPAGVRTLVRLLHGLAGTHEELLALVLSEADYVVPALKAVFEALDLPAPGDVGSAGLDVKERILARQEVLMFSHEVVRAAGPIGIDAVMGLMGSGKLREAYDEVFVVGRLEADAQAVIRQEQDEAASLDPVRMLPSFVSPLRFDLNKLGVADFGPSAWTR